MKQWAFYFDQEYCSGCGTCQIACKDKNNLKQGQIYRAVTEYAGGEYRQDGEAIVQDIFAFFLSMSCNHCKKPACVGVCPTKALRKREKDGLVLLEREKCIGCKACKTACPYAAVQYDCIEKKISKCDFCEDLLALHEAPACVAACPMRALEYGELDELIKMHGNAKQIEGMPALALTEPALLIKPHRNAKVVPNKKFEGRAEENGQ